MKTISRIDATLLDSRKWSWAARRLAGSDTMLPSVSVLLGRLAVFLLMAATVSPSQVIAARMGVPFIAAFTLALAAQLPLVRSIKRRPDRKWLAISLLIDLPVLFTALAATGGLDSPIMAISVCWVVFGILAFPIWLATPYALGVMVLAGIQDSDNKAHRYASPLFDTLPHATAHMVVAVATGMIVFISLLIASYRALNYQVDLEGISRIDALTQLPNRRAFEERFAEMVSLAEACGEEFWVAIVDVDNLKHVNDSSGHEAGDICLVAVATALSEATNGRGNAFRIGGDEFAVLFPIAWSEQILGALGAFSDRYLRWRSFSSAITVSVGAARGKGRSALRAADEALYRAKALGRNRLVKASNS
ncbi:MAG: GGDEF domain-containing protein [Actinomycetota bacterium]|nr:GGDEF domain-containing protein [Actinomycetota bacterium]